MMMIIITTTTIRIVYHTAHILPSFFCQSDFAGTKWNLIALGDVAEPIKPPRGS